MNFVALLRTSDFFFCLHFSSNLTDNTPNSDFSEISKLAPQPDIPEKNTRKKNLVQKSNFSLRNSSQRDVVFKAKFN